MEDKELKSVLYARVSTLDELQNNSYLQQQLYKNDKFEIIKIFSDKASGGSVDKRESFLEMLAYCGIKKDGNNYSIIADSDVECIIVANVSRFSRSIVDARLIIDILHKNNIKVYFIDLNKYSTDSDIFLTLNMFLVIEEEYLRNVSSKVKNGMQRKIDTGYILGSNKIWGYEYKDGYLKPHTIESRMVKNIYKDYLNGSATRELGNKYKLSPNTILGILKNKKYCGYMGYNLKSDNPIYIKSQFIEPLISEEAWEEVQLIRKSRCNSDNGKGRRIVVRNLTGKIKCSCGSTYHYKGRDTQWCCSNSGEARGKTKGCGAKQLHTKIIIPYLEKNIDSIESNLNFQLKKEINSINTESFDILNQKKDELVQKQDKLMDLFLDGSIDKSILKRKQDEIKIDFEEVENKLDILNDMNSHLNELRRIKVNYKNEINNIRRLIKEDDLDSLEKLISKIQLKTIVNITNFKEELVIENIQFKCFNELYNTNYIIFEDE